MQIPGLGEEHPSSAGWQPVQGELAPTEAQEIAFKYNKQHFLSGQALHQLPCEIDCGILTLNQNSTGNPPLEPSHPDPALLWLELHNFQRHLYAQSSVNPTIN